MKDKKIAFGNYYANLIIDNDLKKEILNCLFNKINLNDFRYHMLNSIARLKYLQTTEHYVLPNFYGKNYLLIFCKIKNIKYSVLVDRKKLKYKLEDNVNLNDVMCVSVDIKCNDALYNGSIFDGKLLKDKENNHTFLINDCLFLNGVSVIDIDLIEKFKNVDNTINLKFSSKPCECFSIKYNKIYTYSELKQLIEMDLKTFSFTTVGLIFLPKKSGIYVIYVESKDPKVEFFSSAKEDNKDVVLECPSHNLIYNLKDILLARTYSYETGEKKKNFMMEKTSIPDVYRLFEIGQDIPIGIACVPSMKISHRFAKYFKNRNRSKVSCVYSQQFKKWIPVATLNQ